MGATCARANYFAWKITGVDMRGLVAFKIP